jgi:hypothetical protein
MSNIMKDNTLMFPFPVEIKKSKLAGRGLFATRDIEKGSIVALYPTDIVFSRKRLKNGEEVFLDAGILSWRPMKAFIDAEKLDMEIEDFFELPKGHELHERFGKYIRSRVHNDKEGYSQGISCAKIPQYSDVMGLPEFEDPSFCGHLINDCIQPETIELLRTKPVKNNAQYRKLCNRYERDYKKYCNVQGMSFNCYYAMIAIKPIKKGEELLYVYGADYWRKHYKKRQAEKKKYGYLTKFNPSYRTQFPVDTFRDIRKVQYDLKMISVLLRIEDPKLPIEPMTYKFAGKLEIDWENQGVPEKIMNMKLNEYIE